MNKNTLKFAVLSSALMFSASTMAVGLGVNTGVGVKAEVPGVSLNADAKAKADANANANAAVKGAKSQGDEMRSDAGALHSEAKGEVGKRTGQLESAGDVKAKADMKADVKAGGKLKADKK
jgi:hypothetical protein